MLKDTETFMWALKSHRSYDWPHCGWAVSRPYKNGAALYKKELTINSMILYKDSSALKWVVCAEWDIPVSLAKKRARHKAWVSRVIDTEILLRFELNHSPIHHESLNASEWELDLGFCSVLPQHRPVFPLDEGLESKLWEIMVFYTPFWCYLLPQQIFIEFTSHGFELFCVWHIRACFKCTFQLPP